MARNLKTKATNRITETNTHHCDCPECRGIRLASAIKKAEDAFLQNLARLGLTVEEAMDSIYDLHLDLDLEVSRYCETVTLAAILAART